jgi:hypothetical protein
MVASERFSLTGAGDGTPDLEVSFDVPETGSGLVFRDPIERRQFRLETPEPVAPREADPDAFLFPVDSAVSIETSAIQLPTVMTVIVRNDDGEALAHTEHLASESFSEGIYRIEIDAPVKTYLHVRGPLVVRSDLTQTAIEFDKRSSVHVGARSYHERPATTITTTDDPRDLMAAVSALGSALKTTSPERSYPTLRGHPPLLERDNRLHIPEGLKAPDTGISIRLPPDYRYIFVATPLAYYLGATVVPGDVPEIVSEDGFRHRLDGIAGFENEVERVLKQTFFFDCLTRTEGLYDVDLHERSVLEPKLDLDFADLYEQSPASRLEAYLGVPFTVVEEHIPEWKLTTHIAPDADNLELLPFVTNDLAVVRTPQSTPVPSSKVQTSATDEFFRDDSFVRSATSTKASREYVQPEKTDSLEQAWAGEGTPVGANKTSKQAYLNHLDRPSSDEDISLTVVCNDSKMAEERDVVESVYGSREELPFEVEIFYNQTVGELRTLLDSQTDFFHYIGHIDERGFACADGRLDVSDIGETGVDSFLLNACQSYEQGQSLIDAGSVGGIVTLADVVNSGAVEMGETLARLLNRGFSLRSALEIAQDRNAIGNQYLVVGDGGMSVTQPTGNVPNVCKIRQTGERFELEYHTYPTVGQGMGTTVMPHISWNNKHYLSSGKVESFDLTRVELEQFLSLEDVPVLVNGDLRWSESLEIDDFSVGD